MTENKTLDLIVDQNVPFGLLLQFLEEDGTPSSLTDFTMRGSIKKNLEDTSTIKDFTCLITSEENGLATISLSFEDVASLIPFMDDKPVGAYDPRQRLVGFYDILLSNDSKSFRIMQGRVIISLGVTNGN